MHCIVPLCRSGLDPAVHRDENYESPHRHSGLDPESTGRGHCTVIPRGSGNPQGGDDSKTTPTILPSPLMGEESKVRVNQCLTLRSEGVNDALHRHSGLDPESTGRRHCTVIPRGSGPFIGTRMMNLPTVILDLIQNPQGGVDSKTTPTILPISPLMGEETKACPSA